MDDEDIISLLASLDKEPAPKREREEDVKPAKEAHVRVKKTMNQHEARRILSEFHLEKELPWHFEQGVSYHCISWGDVDSLTYLRAIVKQQHVHYALISTWCMAKTDINEIAAWMDKGYIDRCDFFVGEIFKGSYQTEWIQLKELCKARNCRLVMFRNHSKIMLVFGDDFDCAIESSANVNTNPRTEQTCITVDSGLARFYKEIFDGIESFDPSCADVPPFEI